MKYDLNIRDLIFATVEDLVTDFLHYDRITDEELAPTVIERAIKNNLITKEEIVNRFSEALDRHLGA